MAIIGNKLRLWFDFYGTTTTDIKEISPSPSPTSTLAADPSLRLRRLSHYYRGEKRPPASCNYILPGRPLISKRL